MGTTSMSQRDEKVKTTEINKRSEFQSGLDWH